MESEQSCIIMFATFCMKASIQTSNGTVITIISTKECLQKEYTASTKSLTQMHTIDIQTGNLNSKTEDWGATYSGTFMNEGVHGKS